MNGNLTENCTELKKIREKLAKKLKPDRYEHTLGVMYTASSLAMCYGDNIDQALLAGLLHDCGKYCPPKEQIQLCKEYQITLTPAELEMPALVHAKLGAYLAEHEYHVKDPRILNAITYHTTGRPDMTLLEKIVYIADYIEPGRPMIPGLTQIRNIVFQDMDKAICLAAESTLSYLKKQNRSIDPMTEKTFHYYKNI